MEWKKRHLDGKGNPECTEQPELGITGNLELEHVQVVERNAAQLIAGLCGEENDAGQEEGRSQSRI